MSLSLRIALLLDPLTMRDKGAGHAPPLARELLGRGHTVRGFGVPPGVIPRSGDDEGGLRAFRPEVIVAYDALSPGAWMAARVARRTGAALLLIETGDPDGGPIHERVLHRIGERLWGSYVRRTASAVICSDPIAREVALAEGFPQELVSVLPEGVDLAVYRPGLTCHYVVRHRIRGRILLCVGPLVAARGLDLLVKVFARTLGQRHDWCLVLAGDGPERAELRAAADRLGVGDRVLILPRPRPEELPGLFGASTLLAVPTLDGDVRARQTARALACGLPVLASDFPRLRFLVEHEAHGLLVPPGNLEAWAAALERGAGSPTQRQRWSENARRYAAEHLSWERVTEAFEAILLRARERAAA